MSSKKWIPKEHRAEHRIWRGMKGRCLVKSNSVYPQYGARGITICNRWLIFENFLSDMGHQPFPRATIERINTFGNYEPENCRWASQQEQCWNRRSGNSVLTFNGKTQCLGQWAKELGIKSHTLIMRKKRGWPVEQILSPKIFKPHARNHLEEKL